ncbi:DUF4286 family protein [Sphingomonas bacterium]|uniref:DUF4286 family protein n=1 Tax=Sphingomonas bacterium TaxID=1895847 RepID=UPI0015770890|nr:DUF4286 family protein [Sphingomonas bacterium]
MASYILVVPSNAKPGQDEEYNRWYDDTHLGDLLAIPGVTKGRRFNADPASPSPPEANYLAIYEIEAEDGAEVLAELGRRAQAGEMEISPTLDTASARMMLYKAR